MDYVKEVNRLIKNIIYLKDKANNCEIDGIKNALTNVLFEYDKLIKKLFYIKFGGILIKEFPQFNITIKDNSISIDDYSNIELMHMLTIKSEMQFEDEKFIFNARVFARMTKENLSYFQKKLDEIELNKE